MTAQDIGSLVRQRKQEAEERGVELDRCYFFYTENCRNCDSPEGVGYFTGCEDFQPVRSMLKESYHHDELMKKTGGI